MGLTGSTGEVQGHKGHHRGDVAHPRDNTATAQLLGQRDTAGICLRCTFLRLVLIMNSLARCGAGCGSSGRMTMLLSKGSPGTI